MKPITSFKTYASFYDLLYKDKDYAGEALYIHRLILRFFPKPKQQTTILDLACGTGKHAAVLTKKGYSVEGSDISKEMIRIARKNAPPIEFYNYSFQQADKIKKKYGVIISMFSAINYLTTYADQQKAFANIYNLLETDGIFIFDYWNGNAVVRDYSPIRVINKKQQQSSIKRTSKTRLDLIKQEAFVSFNCMYFQEGKPSQEFTEHHHLHYYYFSEIKNLLTAAGFKIIHICPFMQMAQPVDAYEWNISIVAKKV